jgi:very-short-patch-repair endonuclease
MGEARRRSEGMAATQFGVVARPQAIASGLSERAIGRLLANGSWASIHPSTYVVNGAPTSWHRDVIAAVLSAHPDGAASHRTAAALWGCPTFTQDTIEITSLRTLERRGVVVHRTTQLERNEVRRRSSIAVTDPERTLIDLGAVVPRDSVELALDHFLANRLTTLARIEDRLSALHGSGWRGKKKLRSLLEARRPEERSAESALETKLFQVLRGERLALPERQVVICDGSNFIGRVDLAYPAAKLVLEAQSYQHHSSRRAWTADVIRRRDLHVLGWRVVEVTWHDVTVGRREFVSKLRALLNELSLFDRGRIPSSSG